MTTNNEQQLRMKITGKVANTRNRLLMSSLIYQAEGSRPVCYRKCEGFENTWKATLSEWQKDDIHIVGFEETLEVPGNNNQFILGRFILDPPNLEECRKNIEAPSAINESVEEGTDGSWIRVNNITYTLCKEEPFQNQYLTTPYEISEIDGVPIIRFSMLEIVMKKDPVLEIKGVRYVQVPQVPMIFERKTTLKQRPLHICDKIKVRKFVQIDEFTEVADKYVRRVHKIEKIYEEGDDKVFIQ